MVCYRGVEIERVGDSGRGIQYPVTQHGFALNQGYCQAHFIHPLAYTNYGCCRVKYINLRPNTIS